MLNNQILYQSLLKDSYNQLPAALQVLHNLNDGERKEYHGNYTAIVGNGMIAQFIAKLMSLPKTGENLPLRVEFKQQDDIEYWHRYFNQQLFHSIQYKKGNLLYEKVSFMTLAFHIESTQQELLLKLKQMYLFQVPILPLCRFTVTGKEWEEDGRFHFLVQVKAPWIGLIIQYQGFLNITESTEKST